MFKQTLKIIIGKNIIFKAKLIYYKILGYYFVKKPIGKKSDYIKLYNGYLEKIKTNTFVQDNFNNKEISFINNLALNTQVVKKNSKINWMHGFILMKTLKDYLKENSDNKFIILETGTAAGFSALIMSYVLYLHNEEYIIYTIDIVPHNKKIYWNRISDHLVGKTSRRELLNEYLYLLKNIRFVNDVSKNYFRNKLNFKRVNFAFIDGSHDYEDVKAEFDFVDKHNIKGDIIVLDDYSPGKFDGIVKITNEIKNSKKYDINIINSHDNRGYVILKKI